MNITQKLLFVAAVASLVPLQALAQSLTDTITIEGRLTSLSNSFQGPTELGPEASFVAILRSIDKLRLKPICLIFAIMGKRCLAPQSNSTTVRGNRSKPQSQPAATTRPS